MTCDLCGGPMSAIQPRVTIGEYVCHVDCAESLIENEHERRGVREQERLMEEGYDAVTGDDRLRADMAEARKYK